MRQISFFLALGALIGCGGEGLSSVPLSAPASYSGSASTPSVSSFIPSGSSGIAAHVGKLLVRPDAIEVTFAVSKREGDASVLADLEAAVTDVHKRLGAATSSKVNLRVCNVRVEHVSLGKSTPEEAVAIAEGSFEIPLPTEANIWARGRIVAAITSMTAQANTAKDSDALKTAFGAPKPFVKDAEHYRDELTQRWVKRTRGFAQAAQSVDAPLVLTDCAPPQEITQEAISLDEIALSIPFACKLESRSSTRAAP